MEESDKVNEGVETALPEATKLAPEEQGGVFHYDNNAGSIKGDHHGIAAAVLNYGGGIAAGAAVEGNQSNNMVMTREAPAKTNHHSIQPQDPPPGIAHHMVSVHDLHDDPHHHHHHHVNQIGVVDPTGSSENHNNDMATSEVAEHPHHEHHHHHNPNDMATDTATDADIVAMAGEAAVAAVEAGEMVATSNTQGADEDGDEDGDSKKPEAMKEADHMKQATVDIVSVIPKLEDGDPHGDNNDHHHHGDHHSDHQHGDHSNEDHPHGDIPHEVSTMELSPGMEHSDHPDNVRTASDAGLLDSNEKASKRARRKAEPIKPFNDMLYELMAFRSREGHCRVPVDNKSALGRWVASLRSQYSSLQKGYPTADLTEERLMILRNIDFIWDLQQFDSDARWKRQFEELLAYKRENGHCNAPQSTPLGKWVKMQRENYRETQLRAQGALPQNRTKPRPTLSEDRIAQLNSIGFQWKVAPPAAGWEHRFDELVDYKRLHGDCNVPQAWPENRQLGRWVMKQRCQYTLRQKGDRCQITDERIQRLNDLGFSWTAPSFRKNKKGEKEFDIRPKWL
ncbi:hypothetical protein ACA910_022582 [Epithemia clementina (nom. ined.)]